MAISIHNYTILDHLADYLLRIREAVQGDGSYQYVCVMERRCFNLVARFSPELLDRVVTSNGLLCMGKEIANVRGKQKGVDAVIKYYDFEVYTESESTGLVRIRTVRATSSEHAERMVGAGLREGWRIIGVVHQFKNKEEIKK